MPKILLLDIETSPGKAYIWSLWDKFIPIDRLIEPTRMICWSAKWVGEKEVMFGSEWNGTDYFIQALWKLLAEADAVVTYNGDKFDLPRINGEFIQSGLDPIPPVTSIDLYKFARKLGLMSGKLAYIGPLFKIGAKVDTGGFSLWKDVERGDPKALRRMERYNKQDVRLLGRLYLYLRPHIRNHPYLGEKPNACPACDSTNTQRRGYRRTRSFKIEKISCQDCGHWSSGKRQRVGK